MNTSVAPLLTQLDVIIPVYNRGNLIHHTMESVRRVSAGLVVKFVIVEDGSPEPAENGSGELTAAVLALDLDLVRRLQSNPPSASASKPPLASPSRRRQHSSSSRRYCDT